MKRLMWLVAGIFVTTALVAGEWYAGKVTVEAGDTNAASELVSLYKSTGGGAGDIIRVTAHVDSGAGTGSVAFVIMDWGVETAISTSANLTGGTLYDAYPMRTFTGASQTVNLTTNSPVAYVNAGGSFTDTNGVVINMPATTNYYIMTVPYTSTSVSTLYAPYSAREIKVKVTQVAASDDTVYKFSVYVE